MRLRFIELRLQAIPVNQKDITLCIKSAIVVWKFRKDLCRDTPKLKT